MPLWVWTVCRPSNFHTLLFRLHQKLQLMLSSLNFPSMRFSSSSPWHISCRDCGKLRLIYGSRCVVIPIGNVCVMASIWALSKQMRIQRSRRPVWTLCRQAPAGNVQPLLTLFSLIQYDCLFFPTVNHEIQVGKLCSSWLKRRCDPWNMYLRAQAMVYVWVLCLQPCDWDVKLIVSQQPHSFHKYVCFLEAGVFCFSFLPLFFNTVFTTRFLFLSTHVPCSNSEIFNCRLLEKEHK